MKSSNLLQAVISNTINAITLSGTILLIGGSAACFTGLSATVVVKAGEALSSHTSTYKKMMFYGASGTGSALFLLGLGCLLSKVVEKEEIAPVDSGDVDVNPNKPTESALNPCLGCRNYHGHSYNQVELVCAIHPHGCDDIVCPDWTSS